MNLEMKYINLMHILVQGLLLTYIGYNKNNTPKFIYIIIGILALLIPFYNHLPRLSFSYWNLVNILHYLIIIPSFLYVAYYGYQKKLTENIYNNLFISGIIIMIYHSYKLYKRIINL